MLIWNLFHISGLQLHLEWYKREREREREVLVIYHRKETRHNMDFWKLFIVALIPVLKVLLITAVGTFLALERFGILRETARKSMNTVSFIFFFSYFTWNIVSCSKVQSYKIMNWQQVIALVNTKEGILFFSFLHIFFTVYFSP